jgi:2Fe-2S iron-sulfur cluster protein
MVFSWNGRRLSARAGDTIAIALWRHGIARLGSSRKRHRPLGASGSYLQGALVWVDGCPHVRADEAPVEPGMDVRRQNVWPTAGFDVLSLLRFVPTRLLRTGFERPRFLPGGTRRFEWWERMMLFLAGEVSLSPCSENMAMRPGERWDGDLVVVAQPQRVFGYAWCLEVANRARSHVPWAAPSPSCTLRSSSSSNMRRPPCIEMEAWYWHLQEILASHPPCWCASASSWPLADDLFRL